MCGAFMLLSEVGLQIARTNFKTQKNEDAANEEQI